MSVQNINRGEGSLPVYRQLSEALRRDIQHFYQSGDALPSEFELAQRFSVNRHTLRRAVDELVSDGLVVRRHGKGVFVLAPSIDYAIGARTRLTETLEAQGACIQTRVLRKQKIPAQGGVANKLRIASGTEVVFIETLREVDGKPFCISAHFLPLPQFKKVLDTYDSQSLHAFIENNCAVQLTRTESLVSAVMPQSEDAIVLNMPRNLPVLRVKSLNLNMENKLPAEYVVTRFRGDAAQLAIEPR